MTTVEGTSTRAGARRAPENAEFMVDLLRIVDLWRDNTDLPGPANLGQTRIRASMGPATLRRIADELGLDVCETAAGAGMVNLQADWQLELIWVSLHALEHQDGAPQIPADPYRDHVMRGAGIVTATVQDDDADAERLAHHRTR